MSDIEVQKMKKPLALGVITVLVSAVLAACGGGSDGVNIWNGGGGVVVPPGGGNDSGAGPDVLDPIDAEADLDCIPAAPTSGQVIKQSVVSEDGQFDGLGLYANGVATVSYTIESGNNFKIESDGLDANGLATYSPSPKSGKYLGSGGFSNLIFPAPPAPTEEGLIETSLISFTPVDWMQKATKRKELAAVGDEYQTTVLLQAKGKLPSFLAAVYPRYDFIDDPENAAIEVTFAATVKRLPDALEGGIMACQYSVTLKRPDITVDEDAALASYRFYGRDLEPQNSNVANKIALEPYMPMIEGTFATSSQVPFLPVRSMLQHTYGASSPFRWPDGQITSKGNLIEAVALPVSEPIAKQTFTFLSVTGG